MYWDFLKGRDHILKILVPSRVVVLKLGRTSESPGDLLKLQHPSHTPERNSEPLGRALMTVLRHRGEAEKHSHGVRGAVAVQRPTPNPYPTQVHTQPKGIYLPGMASPTRS